jgi:hypothetical protein
MASAPTVCHHPWEQKEDTLRGVLSKTLVTRFDQQQQHQPLRPARIAPSPPIQLPNPKCEKENRLRRAANTDSGDDAAGTARWKKAVGIENASGTTTDDESVTIDDEEEARQQNGLNASVFDIEFED